MVQGLRVGGSRVLKLWVFGFKGCGFGLQGFRFRVLGSWGSGAYKVIVQLLCCSSNNELERISGQILRPALRL